MRLMEDEVCCGENLEEPSSMRHSNGLSSAEIREQTSLVGVQNPWVGVYEEECWVCMYKSSNAQIYVLHVR